MKNGKFTFLLTSILCMLVLALNTYAQNPASDPYPADGGQLVGDPAVLQWVDTTSGATYSVYLGTTSGSLTLLASDVERNSIDAGDLKPGTTYYWQVDVVGTSTVTGTEWSFTVPTYDVAFDRTDFPYGGILTAQAENAPNESVAKLTDNDYGSKWLAFRDSLWVQYQFPNDEKYVITEYTFVSANDAPDRDPFRWAVLGSNDGVAYDTLDKRDSVTFANRFEIQKFSFTNTTAYEYYYFYLDNLNPNPGWSLSQLGEIQLIEYGATIDATVYEAEYPNPANNAKSGLDVVLEWNDNKNYGVSYEVYFGTTSGSLTLLEDSVKTNSVDAGTLTKNTAYYWRVDVLKEGVDTITGTEWTFTTADIVDDVLFQWVVSDTITGAVVAKTVSPNASESYLSAFDNNYDTKWLNTRFDSLPNSITIQLGQAYKVEGYNLVSANDGPDRDPKDFVLLGSNDGTAWDTVDHKVGSKFTARKQSKYIWLENATAYEYYRFDVKAVGNGNACQFSEIELIAFLQKSEINFAPTAEANGPYVGFAKMEISDFSSNGSTDPEGKTLTYLWSFGDGNTSTEANPKHTYNADGIYYAILRVTDDVGYFDFDTAEVKVDPNPNATDRTNDDDGNPLAGATITGEHPDDESPGGEQKENLFDNDPSTKWLTFNGKAWVGYQFPDDKKYKITEYTITSANDWPSRDPKIFYLLGSNDGTNWTAVAGEEAGDVAFPNRFQKLAFSAEFNDTEYNMYRLSVSEVLDPTSEPWHANGILQVAELELIEYKVDAVEENFASKQLVISPNPANFAVYLSNVENVSEVTIYNVLGAEVKTLHNLTRNYIEIYDLEKGMYIITAKTPAGDFVSKFIKK